MSFDAGAIFTELRLDTRKFSARMGKARKSAEKIEGKLRTVGKIGTRAFGGITKSVFSLQGAIAGLGLALRGKGFINVASDMEGFETQLITTMGSLAAAQEQLVWLNKFAATTPFEIPQLVAASVKLEAFGIRSKDVMRTLGDTAAAMGKDIIMTVEALADAQTGEFERLKEFGVKAIMDAGKTFLLFTDRFGNEQRKMIDRNNRAIVTSTLTAIWNEKYAGGMERLSKTWQGMTSNMADHWTQWRDRVMGMGVFDFLKTGLRELLDTIDELKKTGQLDIWAKQLAENVIGSFMVIGKVVVRFPEIWFSMVSRIKTALGFLTSAIDTLFLAPLEMMAKANKAVGDFFGGASENATRELVAIQGIRSALQDTADEFLTQGMALDATAGKWEDFANRASAALDALRVKVTEDFKPPTPPTPGEDSEGGDPLKKDALARADRLAEITRQISFETQLEKQKLETTNALIDMDIAKRMQQRAAVSLVTDAIEDSFSYLAQAFPKMRAFMIGEALMNVGGAIAKAANTHPFFPMGLLMVTKAIAIGKMAMDRIKGTRSGGSVSVGGNVGGNYIEQTDAVAFAGGGGQQVHIAIYALDPASITDETAITIVKLGMAEAVKTTSGTFDDVHIEHVER